jgi:hypothetical protein
VRDPVAISYWERNAGDARTASTDALHLTVSSRSEAALKRYRIPGVLLLIFISLFATLFVSSTKKKRAGSIIEPHAKGGKNAD